MYNHGDSFKFGEAQWRGLMTNGFRYEFPMPSSFEPYAPTIAREVPLDFEAGTASQLRLGQTGGAQHLRSTVDSVSVRRIFPLGIACETLAAVP